MSPHFSRHRPADDPEPDWTESVTFMSCDGVPVEAAEYGQRAAPTATRAVRVVPGWLVAVAALLAASATAAALLWWQHRSRVIVITHRVLPSYTADAAGCPTESRCQVRADTGQPIGATARRLFPDATVISSISVTDLGTGRTVWTTIMLRAPSGLEFSATAQCVPGGGPIPGRAAPLPLVGPAQADFVVPGRVGCSVAVSAQIPRSVPVPLAGLVQLAGDPAVQLSQ